MPTHFEQLGLPTRFAVDAEVLERNYLERSRALHPDVHQQASASQQRVSMEMAAALNDAYAVLKQPFRRADYLLGLLGGPSAADMKEMEPAFLEEMLDLRMEIEELRESGAADSAGRLQMQEQLTHRADKLVEELASLFQQVESRPDAGKLRRIRQVLNAAKYIQGLLRDLRAD